MGTTKIGDYYYSDCTTCPFREQECPKYVAIRGFIIALLFEYDQDIEKAYKRAVEHLDEAVYIYEHHIDGPLDSSHYMFGSLVLLMKILVDNKDKLSWAKQEPEPEPVTEDTAMPDTRVNRNIDILNLPTEWKRKD